MELELKNVSVQLPGMKRPLFTVDHLHVATGARVAIEGPSGRGKTTLLHLLAGLLAQSSGTVRVGEHDLRELSEAERARFRREHLGLVFQKLNLLSHLTADENVRLGSFATIDAEAALSRVGLADKSKVLASALSLGQQQRVAVARVLAKKPSLILADEPTSSLDDENAEAVLQALLSVSPQTTVVVVSHDHRVRAKFSRVINFSEVAKS